jgi:mannosyltransferase
VSTAAGAAGTAQAQHQTRRGVPSARAGLTAYFLIVITVAGALLRIYLIGDKDLWLDEAFSVWMGWNSLPDLMDWLVRIDQHPPLYYTFLHFWLTFGDSAAHVRTLSAIFGTLTIPVLFFIARRISGTPAGLIAALILAISPFNVRFAQEARMYTLLALNVAVAILALVHLLGDPRAATTPIGRQFSAFIRTWRSGRRLPWRAIVTDVAWLGYMAFTAAAVLTQNTAIFFPVAVNLYVLGLIAWRRGRGVEQLSIVNCQLSIVNEGAGGTSSFTIHNSSADFAPPSLSNWLLAQLGAFLIWSPWLIAFVIQSIGVYGEFWIPAPTWQTVVDALLALTNAFLPREITWGAVVWAGYALVLVLGMAHLRRRPAVLVFLVVLFFTPIVGELLVSIIRPIFYDRTLIWTTIPLYLLLACGFVQLRYKPLMAAGLILLVTVNLLSLRNYYDNFQKEQWRAAAAYVAQHAADDDLILFNATWVQIPFDFYFRDYNRPVERRGVPVDLFDRGILEPKMAESDLPRLRSLLRHRERVWLVYSHDWYTDPQGLIPAALDAELELTDSQQFKGLQVQRYEVP